MPDADLAILLTLLIGLAARKGRDGNWYVAQVFGAKG